MQLGTQTDGLRSPSIRESLGHTVVACSCTSSTSHPQFANHHSLITTHACLIANDELLETSLTPSAPTQSAFLIANICPAFFSHAPLPTGHSSVIAGHCLTSFLFDTNKTHRIIILMRAPMKTREKRASIRCRFAVRGSGNLACAPFYRPNTLECAAPTANATREIVSPRWPRVCHRSCASPITEHLSPATNHAVLVSPSRAAVKWIAFQHAPLTERGATL
jgi:hypothetical protein